METKKTRKKKTRMKKTRKKKTRKKKTIKKKVERVKRELERRPTGVSLVDGKRQNASLTKCESNTMERIVDSTSRKHHQSHTSQLSR